MLQVKVNEAARAVKARNDIEKYADIAGEVSRSEEALRAIHIYATLSPPEGTSDPRFAHLVGTGIGCMAMGILFGLEMAKGCRTRTRSG